MNYLLKIMVALLVCSLFSFESYGAPRKHQAVNQKETNSNKSSATKEIKETESATPKVEPETEKPEENSQDKLKALESERDVIKVKIDESLSSIQDEKWAGFRSVKWGTNISTLDGFTLVNTQDAKKKGYAKINDDLNIGGAQLKAIMYMFFDDQFAGVGIQTQGKLNYDALRETLVTRFGQPSKKATYAEEYQWEYLPEDVFQGVKIDLKYNRFSEIGICSISSMGMATRLLVQGVVDAQKGAQGDF